MKKKNTCFKLIPAKLGDALDKLAKDEYWPSLEHDGDTWKARCYGIGGDVMVEVSDQPTAVMAIQNLYIAIAKVEAEEQAGFEKEATEAIYK